MASNPDSNVHSGAPSSASRFEAWSAGGFAIGSTWAVFLAIGFAGADPPPGAAPAGALLSRTFLALFVGLGHGALIALLGAALGGWRFARRHSRMVAAVVALALGFAYALGVLSIVKFRLVGSHLRYEDLWFLTRSLGQVSAETSAAERLFLVGVALLPLLLAGAVLGAMALGRRVRVEASNRPSG